MALCARMHWTYWAFPLAAVLFNWQRVVLWYMEASMPQPDSGALRIALHRLGTSRLVKYGSCQLAEGIGCLRDAGDGDFSVPSRDAGRAIPVTLFRAPGPASPRPLLIYFHGGGFVIGSSTSVAGILRAVGRKAGADVVSVDYRLAPETPFPGALDDALDATSGVLAQARAWGVGGGGVFVAGDSAGGTLASLVSLACSGWGDASSLAQARCGGRIEGAVLLYPSVDAPTRLLGSAETGRGPYTSMERWKHRFPLTVGLVQRWLSLYFSGARGVDDPWASPFSLISAAGGAAGGGIVRGSRPPRTLVVVAEEDVLCDEGLEYASFLQREAGGPNVTTVFAAGLPHGFFNLRFTRPGAVEPYVDQFAAFIRPA